MNNDILRQQVKIAKAINNITYKELSDQLNIKQNSFYNWLKGYYDLSYRKQIYLKSIIDELMEN